MITENDYPVEQSWILEVPLSYLILTGVFIPILLLFFVPLGILTGDGWIISFAVIGALIIILAGVCILSTIVATLSKDNFHYSLEKEFIVFHQGIISKQQKNLPYGVIQDIMFYQSLTDRILGLASLTIENASFGGGQIYTNGRAASAWIGFIGNVVTIPGLTKENAEKLRKILLSKMKEFPAESNGSGL